MADARHSGIGMTSARTRERLVLRLMEQGIKDPRVLDRVRNVPRHLFVDEALASRAYEDTALPIGFGQTISQPYVVARMTEALHGSASTTLRNVLEIGTGCGYQTAILAPLVARVSTVERMQPLLERAKLMVKELGIKNVRFRHGDGSLGWKAHGPYDGILVAAAAHAVPQSLLEQLSPNGGRLVLPVGPDGAQELLRITRRDDHFVREKLGGVSFVPLVGGIG
jgi:protein-L-isoaspartate(D-aspartate) O-methyltransferase